MRIIPLGIAALLCLAASSPGVYGQSQRPEPPNNVAKINLGSLIPGNLSLSYERALGDHTSFQIHGNYLFRNRLPGSIRDSLFNNEQIDDQHLTIGEPRFSGWGVTPEFRWYFINSQTAPRGLYAAAYLRTWSYSGKMDVFYQDETTDVQVEGKVTYFAVKPGLQLGYQFLIGNRVSLDIFAGLNYGLNGIRGTLSGNMLPEAYDKIVDEFVILSGNEGEAAEQLAQELKSLMPENNRVSAATTFPTPLVGFRSGITLGIAF